MGEPGERGFSARPRGARPRAESDAALADGTAAPAEPPATKVRKAQKLPNAPKLLHKMKKASHPDHQHLEFSVAEGEDRIWCNACGYSFGTKANVRDDHWACEAHKKAVQALQKKAEDAATKKRQDTQQSMEQALAAAADGVLAKKIKDQAVTNHRMRVMRALMERGIALDVVDGELLELLEEVRDHRLDLGHKSNLARNFMGLHAAEVFGGLAAEHKDVQMALAFDSTPWNDDLAIVVSRVCTEDFRLRHRLVAVKCFASALNAANWVHVIGDVIKMLGIERGNVRVGLTDGCNTMVKVGRDLEEELQSMVALRCLPHFWQKIPGKFGLAEVASLMAAWNAVFKNSGSARHVFKKITKARWARKHKIRWNAAFVQCEQLLQHFSLLGAVVEALREKGFCEKSLPALEKLLQNEKSDTSNLALALAVHHDAALPFVTITKFLEGDGFLSPFVSSCILRVRQFVLDLNASKLPVEMDVPNVFKIFAKFGGAVNKEAKWGMLKQKLLPGFQYMWKVLGDGELDDEKGKYSTGVYDMAETFHPALCMANIRLPTFNLTKLLSTSHVTRLLGLQLCGELLNDFSKLTTAYFPFKEQEFNPYSLLDWWRDNGSKTGAWAAAARLFVLCQPNSELAERAGSILRSRTSDQQGKQLEETFEVSSILAFKYAETRRAPEHAK